MTFEFKNIGCIASNKITEFILKNEKAYNLRYINDNEPIVFDEKSKIYECYLNEVLVAFIILEGWYYGDGYEIIFGTLTDDTNVHFTEILRQFLQNEYKEDLKIFALVQYGNPDKQTVFKILEKNEFIQSTYKQTKVYKDSRENGLLEDGPDEFVYIPANNCEPT